MSDGMPLRHGVSFGALFLFGANLLTGGSYCGEQDSWISMSIALLLLLLWSAFLLRISRLSPGMDVVDLMSLIPSPLRLFFTFAVGWYCFSQAAVILRTYAGFSRIVSLANTDIIFLTLLSSVAIWYFLRRDFNVLFRFSFVALLPILFLVFLIFLLLIPQFRTELLFPVLYRNGSDVAFGVMESFSFPFGNAFLLLGFLGSENRRESRFAWRTSVFIAGLISLLIVFQNLLLLGGKLAADLNFPYNFSTSLVNVADFFSRLEVFASLFFYLSAIVRSAFFVKITAKCIGSLCRVEERILALPVAAALCGYSLVLFDNTNSVFRYLRIFPYLALPLQIFLPFLLWIFLERRRRKFGRKPTAFSLTPNEEPGSATK